MNSCASPGRRGLARAAAACALLPAALRSRAATAASQVQRSRAALMGTRVDIVLEHADPLRRQQALDAAWSEMFRLSEMMSRYRSASQVNRLAAAAGEAAMPIAPELMAVLQQAQALHRHSAGRFDVSVGAYTDWHFEAGQPARVPDAGTLQRQSALVGAAALELDAQRGTARLARRGMQLDLGGIAKLPILEAGMQALHQHGISHALINGGGDVVCAGTLQGMPWRIGLRNPRRPAELLGVLALQGGVVAASGDYERSFDIAGKHYHHILDPRSGQPTQGLRGLALVAGQVSEVNGWGAAMMVAGTAQAQRWLRSPLQGVDAMLADDQGVWFTAGLRRRLERTA